MDSQWALLDEFGFNTYIFNGWAAVKPEKQWALEQIIMSLFKGADLKLNV